MGGLDAYLDHACGGLRLNPAKAEDIRRELRAHLEERIHDAVAQGLSRKEALARALAGFGRPEKVRACLSEAHVGEPWWLSRLRGITVGMLAGTAIAGLVLVAEHLGLAPLLHGGAEERTQLLTIGLIVGGATGLFPGRNRELIAGPAVGALVWMTEAGRAFVGSVDQVLPSAVDLRIFESAVLSPSIGFLFGAAVAVTASVVLSLSARLYRRVR
jgi:hypothetical protein